MFITYKGTKVYCKVVGDGDVPILFLHGWGGSTKSFEFLIPHLEVNYKAIFVDFPPFGNSAEPDIPFDIYDYLNMVISILDKLDIINPICVGHSFGGRVGILLASIGLIDKLVLIDSAGMKVRHGPIYYLKVFKHKTLRRIGIKSRGGSKDYLALSKDMRKTFVNIVNENLEDYAKCIKCPTLIFWGEKDRETPLYMAKKLNKLIDCCKLEVAKGAGHFAYIDVMPSFIQCLNNFLKGAL